MFIECRKYFMDLLETAGVKRKPFTSQKQMKMSNESHLGAVLFEEESLEKDGSKKIYQSPDAKKKRRKKFSREVTFSIVIGEYTIEKVQDIYEKFLENLADGIYVDGNYVKIEPQETDWIDNEDTIIKSKCAVQFKIRCDGGVYKDTGYANIQDVDIVVEKGGNND